MNALTRRLGTDTAVLQAPMAGSQGGRLALAVAHAGGLGALPAAMLSPAQLNAELSVLRAQLGHRYNVNFFCHRVPDEDAAGATRWQAALAPYYAEFRIAADTVATAPSRTPFDAGNIALLAEFRPAVISFHFGLPDADLLAPLRGWGAKIIASATTVAEALWLEQRGVDAIIAQGYEAGGHRGLFLDADLDSQVGTFALLPQIVRAVRVPVIAAGGISDAASVAAALRLGASGVQAGTAYLLCPEADTRAVHRAALQSPAAAHTALTNVFSGRPARGIVNRLVRELGPISPLAPAFPLATNAVAALRAAAEASGNGDFSPLWAGQHATACRAVPAAEVTCELLRGFSRYP